MESNNAPSQIPSEITILDLFVATLSIQGPCTIKCNRTMTRCRAPGLATLLMDVTESHPFPGDDIREVVREVLFNNIRMK